MDVTQANLGPFIEELTIQAVKAARERYGVTLDFSMNSLQMVYNLIDQARQVYTSSSVSEQGLERTIQVWGAYLGETMRRNKRGVWKLDPEQTGDRHIYLTTQNVKLYPFEQVRQRITGQEPVLPERDMPPPPPEPDKPKTKSIAILIVGISIFAILAVIVFMVIEQLKKTHIEEVASQRAAYAAQFLPFMGDYLKDYPNPAGHDPILKGKVLVVNKNTGSIANLQYQLPDRIKAANPQDISVVVQYDCKVIETGVSDGTTANLNRISCRLTLVDFAQKETGDQQDFVGTEASGGQRVDENGLPIDEVGGGLDPKQMAIWLDALIE